MNLLIFGGFLSQPRIKIAVLALAFMMVATQRLGLVSAWARHDAQNESELKLETPKVSVESAINGQNFEKSAAPVKPLKLEKGLVEKTPSKIAYCFKEFQDIKPDDPKQKQVFEVLNQQLRQKIASYNDEVSTSGWLNPFAPPTALVTQTLGKLRADYEMEKLCQRIPFCTPRNPCKGAGPFCQAPNNQIKLVAIITVSSDGSGPLALIENSLGVSYVFRVGDRIGSVTGRIIKITGSAVTVEEKIKNFMGEDKTRITELKLYHAAPNSD